MQRAEEAERQRLDAELAARTAASAAQLAQIEEQQKQIEAQARVLFCCPRILLHCPARHVGHRVSGCICRWMLSSLLQLSCHRWCLKSVTAQRLSACTFACHPSDCGRVAEGAFVKRLVQAALLAQQEAQLAEQQRLQAAAAAAAAAGSFEQFPPAADPPPAAAAPVQPGAPPAAAGPVAVAALPAANGLPGGRALRPWPAASYICAELAQKHDMFRQQV